MVNKKIKKRDQNKDCYNILQMLLIFIMNKNVPLHPNSSYSQICISKRQKSDIINIIRQPKPVSLFETISLIRTHFLGHTAQS